MLSAETRNWKTKLGSSVITVTRPGTLEKLVGNSMENQQIGKVHMRESSQKFQQLMKFLQEIFARNR